MAGIAGKVNANSGAMVDLMDQTMENFSNIASATEEMTATISDIAGSADNTREITAKAVAQSEAAMTQMTGLAESATAINKITEAQMTGSQMVVFTLFVVFYVPCVATIAVIAKELGWRDAGWITGLTAAAAIVIGVLSRVLFGGMA